MIFGLIKQLHLLGKYPLKHDEYVKLSGRWPYTPQEIKDQHAKQFDIFSAMDFILKKGNKQ